MIRAIGLPVLASLIALLLRWLVSRSRKRALGRPDLVFGYEWIVTALLLLAVFSVDVRHERESNDKGAAVLTLQLQQSTAPMDGVANRVDPPDVAGATSECDHHFWTRAPAAAANSRALWTSLCQSLKSTSDRVEAEQAFLDRVPLILFGLTLMTWALTEITRSLGNRQRVNGSVELHAFYGIALPNIVGFCALIVVFAVSGAAS
jgi:hypothetical protein